MGGIAWWVALGARRVVLVRRALVGDVDRLTVVEEDEGRQSAAAPAVDVDPALIILGSKA